MVWWNNLVFISIIDEDNFGDFIAAISELHQTFSYCVFYSEHFHMWHILFIESPRDDSRPTYPVGLGPTRPRTLDSLLRPFYQPFPDSCEHKTLK